MTDLNFKTNLSTESQVSFVEETFNKVARENNMQLNNFNWSKSNKPFEIFTLYPDSRPTTSSSNTVIIK